MANKPEVDGWLEPVAEGLWRPDLLFYIPRNLNYLHLFWIVLMVADSWNWAYAAAGMHVLFFRLTEADPEWPKTMMDFFREPSELEP